ncbi:MAG: FAD-binding oxidoreductase [Alphaproteobacteria bacterium]|nr:FAD-binding oxidoreductase [Alphaproteobacteria bacterium]
MNEPIQSFSEIVGAEHVLTSPADKVRYEEDWRYENGKAAFIVRPGNTEEVAAVVRVCGVRGLKIVPQGAVTGLVGASVPDQSGTQIVLSLERLKVPLSIDPVNRTATAGAGVLLSALNEAAGAHGLFFPIDLGADPMLGGMVAANTGGSRLIRYGDVRHNLLGLEVVDGQGNIFNLLKDLRKDNTGLDLKQVFVGTGGAFGVVTAAVVALAPVPVQRATVLAVPRSLEEVNTILMAAEREFGSLLTSFEGMSRHAMDYAIRHVPNTPNPFGGEIPEYALLIELSSQSTEEGGDLEDRLVGFVMAHYDEQGGKPIIDAVTGRAEGLWALRHHLSEGLRHEGKVIGLDISVSRSQLWTFKSAAKVLLKKEFPFLKLCDFGHCGDGSDHFNLVWTAEAGPYDPEQARAVRQAVYELLVRSYGGSFSAEHGIGPANQAYYHQYVPQEVQGVAGQFKRIFDPRDVLGNIRLGCEG